MKQIPTNHSSCLGIAALAFVLHAPLYAQTTSVNLRGTVTDSTGAALAGVAVKLEGLSLTATTGADGAFVLGSATSGVFADLAPARPVAMRDGMLYLAVDQKTQIEVTAFGLRGEKLGTLSSEVDVGSRALALPHSMSASGSGVRFFKVKAGEHTSLINALFIDGSSRAAFSTTQAATPNPALAKAARTSAVIYDVITATKTGYQKAYVSITNSDSTGIRIKMLSSGAPKFSFFVTSQKALQELSKSENGFGGDFRFGETGPGAGLRGADKICATIAEKSMPGSTVKGWRAFLSVTADASGKQVNAIERIGEGPWYDRVGRLLAPQKADLLNVRPQNGDITIRNDLPNEHGVPNHAPEAGQGNVDNHHTVTGSSATGTLASATATCKDWTTAEGVAANGKPMCGFSWPRSSSATGSGSNWMTTFSAAGCGAGHHFDGSGGQATGTGLIIGNNGGYGGFYCFALNP